jgi:hypothetical protein
MLSIPTKAWQTTGEELIQNSIDQKERETIESTRRTTYDHLKDKQINKPSKRDLSRVWDSYGCKTIETQQELETKIIDYIVLLQG